MTKRDKKPSSLDNAFNISNHHQITRNVIQVTMILRVCVCTHVNVKSIKYIFFCVVYIVSCLFIQSVFNEVNSGNKNARNDA